MKLYFKPFIFLIISILSMAFLFAQDEGNIKDTIATAKKTPLKITMPRYIGGEEAMLKYISESLVYPKQADKDKIEGRVLVRFVVSKSGEVKDAEVVKSVHPLLDEEAVRVVSSMPDWIPGAKEGVPVNVIYTIPINFKRTRPLDLDKDLLKNIRKK